MTTAIGLIAWLGLTTLLAILISNVLLMVHCHVTHHHKHKHPWHPPDLTAALITGEDGMQTIKFGIGPANEGDVTKRVITFTAKEPAPVSVELDGPGATTATTPVLTGTYAVGDQITDAALVQSNANGDAAPVPVPALTLANGSLPQQGDVTTLTAALVTA